MGYYAGPKSPNICSHVKFGLRGCTRRSGHNGPHTNMFDSKAELWDDRDGMYCETHEDWVHMIDMMGKRTNQ